MRRHPARVTPKTAETAVFSAVNWNRNRNIERDTKRGPKNRRKAWPLLNYTIVKGIGVVMS